MDTGIDIVNLSSLIEHKGDMESVMTKYPEFFPDFKAGNIDYSRFKDGACNIIKDDAWGCQWHYSMHGIESCVINPPIERVFSDAKEKHAMRYTPYRGLNSLP